MSQRGWARAELGVAVAGVTAGLWLLRTRESEPWLLLIAAAIAAIGVASHRRRRRLGVATGAPTVSSARAWIEAALATAMLIGIVAAWVAFVREPYDEVRLAVLDRHSVELLFWLVRRLLLAAAQQAALQLFLWPVCRELVRGDQAATVAAAALFGLAHLPSPTLVVLTFLAAWTWIWLYRRGRRLAPLVLAHAVLWVAAFAIVPDRLTYDMRVGAQAVDTLPRYRVLASQEGRAILRAVTSPEYAAREGGSDRGFVRALYRDILGRTPADAEVEFWVRRLEGESRTEVAKKFVISDELQQLRREYGARYRFPFRR